MIANRQTFPVLGLLALVVVCYAGSLGHGFVFDDDHSIVDNPSLESLSSIPRFFVDASTFSGRPEHGVMYRPLVVTTLAINHALSGMQPWSYHLLNLLLHAVTCVLLWRFLRTWSHLSDAAWWLAAVMAVHPIHSETVNYVSARAGLLATMGVLTAVALASRAKSVQGGLAVFAALLGGLLAKSTALLGLPLLALRAIGRHGYGWRTWKVAGIASACACGLYLIVATSSGFLGSSLSQLVRPLDVQILTQTKVSIYYLWLIALPVHLSPVHAFQIAWTVSPAVVAAGALLLSIIGLSVRHWWASGDLGAFGMLWFYGSLGITFLMPLNVVVSEHRLYLPWIGLSIAVVWWLGRSRLSVRWLWITLPLLAILTMQRGPAWASELTLWSAAAESAGQDPRVQTNLASALLEAKRFDEAQQAYERALAADASYTTAMSGLSSVHEQIGDNAAAELWLRRALAIDPEWAELHRRLGQLLIERGAHQEAELAMAAALRLDTSPEGLVRMGVAQRHKGDLLAARRSFEQALDLSPNLVDALVNLGGIQQEQALAANAPSAVELQAARQLYEQALRLQPDHTEAQQNLTGLLGMIANAQAQGGDLAGAEQTMGRLIELAGSTPARAYNRAEVLTALGQQHLAAGDRDGAQRHWREALSLYRQAGVDYRRSRQRIETLNQHLR